MSVLGWFGVGTSAPACFPFFSMLKEALLVSRSLEIPF